MMSRKRNGGRVRGMGRKETMKNHFYTTHTQIVKCNDDGKIIWQHSGQEIDEILSHLETIARAAKVFGDYFDCIAPEFDDDQYVGEIGFQAHYFRELHAALAALRGEGGKEITWQK